MHGRNAIGVFIIIIKHSRPLCPIVSGRWPLFLAVIFGCRAGLLREALHKVYISRVQRGDAAFAAKVLDARGPLLSVLAHFFEHGRWGSVVEAGIEGQSLVAEDELFVLAQAGLYLTATRGFAAPETMVCHERLASLCHSLGRPLLLYSALMGQWRYSLFTDKPNAALQIAERVHSLAQEQNHTALMIGAYRALAVTHYYSGNDFQTSLQYARQGIQLWRSGRVPSPVEEPITPATTCLCYAALSEWHLGEIASCRATIAETIALAKELNDMQALAHVLMLVAILAQFERNPSEVERRASDVIELSTRQIFATWLPGAVALRGWAHGVSGDTAEGMALIQEGIENWRAPGTMHLVPYWLALKAEVLHLAAYTPKALEAIMEAETLAERSEQRWWCAELHRLRGVFLAAIGTDEAQIEASLGEAIRIAKEQKSISLQKRAEATCAEYRRQKASGSGGREFRLPLC